MQRDYPTDQFKSLFAYTEHNTCLACWCVCVRARQFYFSLINSFLVNSLFSELFKAKHNIATIDMFH